MEYLTIEDILDLHQLIVDTSGGGTGVRDKQLLFSCIQSLLMTFGGEDLYPGIAEKAACLCFSPVMNHPFVDGNKRIGHAALEYLLNLNGYEIEASIDEQEQIILDLASGLLDRETFTHWVLAKLVPFQEF